MISRNQVEQMIAAHCEPTGEEDKQDLEHYKVKVYTWIKGKFSKYATQQGGTMMTYEDCSNFLEQHPSIIQDLTINVNKYTEHFHEVEHRRKVASMLLGRSRSGSDEAIKLHPDPISPGI